MFFFNVLNLGPYRTYIEGPFEFPQRSQIHTDHGEGNKLDNKHISTTTKSYKKNGRSTRKGYPVDATHITRNEVKKPFQRPSHPPSIIVPSDLRRNKPKPPSTSSSASLSKTNERNCFRFDSVTGDLAYNDLSHVHTQETKDDHVEFSFDRFIKGTTGKFSTYGDDADDDWRSVGSGGCDCHSFIVKNTFLTR